MMRAGVRIGVGTRVMFDGELFEVTELLSSAHGSEIVLKSASSVCRMSLGELLSSPWARVITDGPGPDPNDIDDPAAVVLSGIDKAELARIRDLAGHLRECATGYRSGNPETAIAGEPRPQYDPHLSKGQRNRSKAAELKITERHLRRLLATYGCRGEAGLTSVRSQGRSRIDERWIQTAMAIKAEYVNESKPTYSCLIYQINKRLEQSLGKGSFKQPSRAAAYRELAKLEKILPTVGGTTKRNRDVAGRPHRTYGKLRATRPGEYLILDTTPLDVFALDSMTLTWLPVQLTVAMDWYTRCVVALRLTPVSAKAVDAAAIMYQVFRPPLADPSWPDDAVWPEHGIPREVLIDPDQFTRNAKATCGPAVNPETIIIDHAKIYVSEHLNSVCQRMGISIQPAHIREGRDKSPLERFFRTIRESLLQYLPGYKGPDVNARGLNVEQHACLFIDELEYIIRFWVATVYHRRKHDGLIDPGLPMARLTPTQMFSQGIARAGYIEAPRDPQLAYEFLAVERRTIQHYGVQRGTLIYKGDILSELRERESPYGKKYGPHTWPIHVDVDDVRYVYIRHPDTREWHTLTWEHERGFRIAFSDEALRSSRKAVRDPEGYVDQRQALDLMMTRLNLGLGNSVADRRMAVRAAREHAMLSKQVRSDREVVAALPPVERALASNTSGESPDDIHDVEPAILNAPDIMRVGGDDDTDEELEGDYDEMDWA